MSDSEPRQTLRERLRLAGSQGELVASLSSLDLGPRSKRSDVAQAQQMTSAGEWLPLALSLCPANSATKTDASKANEKLSEEIQQLAEALEQVALRVVVACSVAFPDSPHVGMLLYHLYSDSKQE